MFRDRGISRDEWVDMGFEADCWEFFTRYCGLGGNFDLQWVDIVTCCDETQVSYQILGNANLASPLASYSTRDEAKTAVAKLILFGIGYREWSPPFLP